jgi:fibronectin type 3 domain-containing protein
MNSILKNCFFFVFIFVSTTMIAQKPVAPFELSASYQKFANRIELEWKTKMVNRKYNIFRSDNGKKKFALIGTVEQNRYIDKKSLKIKTAYVYRVSAVAPNGIASDFSNDATGALLIVASEKDSSNSTNVPPLKDCMDVILTDAKTSAKNYILKFTITAKCDMPKTVQLSLYRSDDALLDAQDNFLNQQTFDLTRTRGALTSNNNGESTNGYLILKIETNEDSFIVVRKIE